MKAPDKHMYGVERFDAGAGGKRVEGEFEKKIEKIMGRTIEAQRRINHGKTA